MRERHNVSEHAKRGFYEVQRQGRSTTYVRKGWHLVECDGEAHSNPFIDNCYICAPLWGDVAVPDWVTGMEHYRDAAAAARGLSRWLGYD
jgi:hypothetical protein